MAEQEDEGGAFDWALAIFGVALAAWGLYTSFLVAGALLDEVVQHNTARWIGSLVLALILPAFAALGVSSKKEKVPPSRWIWRATSAAAILSMGTALIIGITMADKVVGSLQNDPNWFMENRHAQSGPPALNRQYSARVAHACGKIAHKAGFYYYPN